MLDRVSLYKIIDIDTRILDERKWHIKVNEDKGWTLYTKYVEYVKLAYIDYEHKELNRLCITTEDL